jgi:hypothetical protein
MCQISIKKGKEKKRKHMYRLEGISTRALSVAPVPRGAVVHAAHFAFLLYLPGVFVVGASASVEGWVVAFVVCPGCVVIRPLVVLDA